MLAELELQQKLDSNGIEQKISSGEECAAGISCNFYPLGMGFGLKMYRGRHSLKRRDNNYMMQEHMHKLGFAPKVYNKVQIGELFGFITEQCTVCRDMYDMIEGRAARVKFNGETCTAIDALEKKLPDYICPGDTGLNNCGFTLENKLVFIDLGNFCVEDCRYGVDDTKTEDLQVALDKQL